MNNKTKAALLICSLVFVLILLGIGIAIVIKVYNNNDSNKSTVPGQEGVPPEDVFGFSVSDPSQQSVTTNPFESSTINNTKIEKFGKLEKATGPIVTLEWSASTDVFFSVRVACLIKGASANSSIEYRFSGQVNQGKLSFEEANKSISGTVLPEAEWPVIEAANVSAGNVGLSLVSVTENYSYIADLIVIFK